TLYDSGIETALLARWPAGGVVGGRVCEALISNVDVLPTLLEAAGAPVPDHVQERTFLSLLQGRPGTPRAAVFAEKTYHEHYDPQRCVRTARHKLIHHFEVSNTAYTPTDIIRSPTYPTVVGELAAVRGMIELYDLEADPVEQRNLAGDPAQA